MPDARRIRSTVLVLAATGCSTLELPSGPNEEGLLAVYETPDATLVPSELREIVSEAAERRREVLVVERLSIVSDGVDLTARSLAEYAGGRSPSLTIDASFAAETRCPVRGSLTYRAVLERSVLRKTLWGTFESCGAPEEASATLSGDFSATLAKDLPIARVLEEDFERGPLLLRVDGLLEGASTTPLELDLRVLGDERFEVRVPRRDGSLIVRYTDEGENFVLRAANGTFCCVESERVCFGVSGPSCSAERSPGEEIPW